MAVASAPSSIVVLLEQLLLPGSLPKPELAVRFCSIPRGLSRRITLVESSLPISQFALSAAINLRSLPGLFSMTKLPQGNRPFIS